MFSTKRIGDALAPLGFVPGFKTATETWFIRPNRQLRLFEVVHVHAGKQRGGRWGDFANAGVCIALTPGRFTSPKGMAECACIINSTPTTNKEEAQARLRGWTNTKIAQNARPWEASVVRSVPTALDTLLRDRAGELLARTATVQCAVERYLRLIDPRLTFPELMSRLSEGATEEELREARRLARTEWLICLPERHWYDLIAILIVRHAAEVEGDGSLFWGKCPNKVPELQWRFQLLASRLYPERGWEWLEAS